MSREDILKCMNVTDGDTNNLLVSYYLNPRRSYSEQEKEYLKSKKEDYLLVAKVIDSGFPIIFCFNSPKIKYTISDTDN